MGPRKVESEKRIAALVDWQWLLAARGRLRHYSASGRRFTWLLRSENQTGMVVAAAECPACAAQSLLEWLRTACRGGPNKRRRGIR